MNDQMCRFGATFHVYHGSHTLQSQLKAMRHASIHWKKLRIGSFTVWDAVFVVASSKGVYNHTMGSPT